MFPQIKHYKQTDIADLFNIDTDSAHRALKDCEMCKKIYDKIKIIGLPININYGIFNNNDVNNY